MHTPSEQPVGHKAPPSADAVRQLRTEQLSLLIAKRLRGCLRRLLSPCSPSPGGHRNLAGVALPVYGLRVLLIRCYRNRISTTEQRRRAAYLLPASTFITGLIWGWGTLFLYPEHSVIHQVFLVLVTAGLSSGSTVTYSALRWVSAGSSPRP